MEPIANIRASPLAASSSPFPDQQLNLTAAIRMASPSTDHVSLSLLLPAIFYLLNSSICSSSTSVITLFTNPSVYTLLINFQTILRCQPNLTNFK